MTVNADPMARFSFTRRNLLGVAALLGVGLVAPGCTVATAEPFAAADRALIAALAELIIPATDTGGAKAAGVPDFIEMMVTRWFDAAEREHFLAGMAAFAKGATEAFGKPFDRLSGIDQAKYFGGLLASAEAAPPRPPAKPADPPRSPFVVLMKRLTVFGYYTSEIGATVELSSEMAFSHFDPDGPSKPNERADAAVLFPLFPFSAK